MKQLKPSLVLIEWEDSAQPDGQWRYIDGLNPGTIVRCTSVGYLLESDAKTKALAQNVAALGTDDAQASGIIRIPTRAVTRIKRLRG